MENKCYYPLIGGSGDKVKIMSISIYEITDSIENRTLLYHYDNEEISDLFIDRETLPFYRI